LVTELEERISLAEPENTHIQLLMKEVSDEVCRKIEVLTANYPRSFSTFANFMDQFGRNPLQDILPTIIDVAADKKGLPDTGNHISKMATMRNVEPASEIKIQF